MGFKNVEVQKVQRLELKDEIVVKNDFIKFITYKYFLFDTVTFEIITCDLFAQGSIGDTLKLSLEARGVSSQLQSTISVREKKINAFNLMDVFLYRAFAFD